MPPTTGIGPGVERMAMIFTEQENIDDVIFFPMMRPSVSPVNASIYGVAEPTLAPVEDLALSAEDFEALCREGALKPHARHLILKPHVRLWGAVPGQSRGSGHVEIEGFLPNSVLRLAGYQLKAEETLSEEEEKEAAGRHDRVIPGQIPAGEIPGVPGRGFPSHRAAPGLARFENTRAGGGTGGEDAGLPAGLLFIGLVQRAGGALDSVGPHQADRAAAKAPAGHTAADDAARCPDPLGNVHNVSSSGQLTS